MTMSRTLLIVGGGVVGAYLWWRSKQASPASSTREQQPSAPKLSGRWVWPVPLWNGRSPVISDGFNSARAGYLRHGGADIMFKRAPSDRFAVGSPNGSKAFVMPDDVPALAAADGTVSSALKSPRGYAIVIDHKPNKASTFYTHLEKLFVSTGAPVRAGQPIGIIGFDPLDPQRLKHLHFELRLGGPKDAVDPALAMRSWSVMPDPNSLVARNARRLLQRSCHA